MKISIPVLVVFTFLLIACSSKEEIIMVTNPDSDNLEISMGLTCYAIIEWGDGSKDEYLSTSLLDDQIKHTYSKAGTYKIQIEIKVPFIYDDRKHLDIDCSDMNLTTLDIRNINYLTTLQCENNRLEELDLKMYQSLNTLYCQNNMLKELDLRNNAALSDLNCMDNQLTTLDLSHNPALSILSCSGNELTELDISGDKLIMILCEDTRLSSSALDKLFEALPDRNGEMVSEGVIYCSKNEAFSSCNSQIAKDKNWNVY